MKNKKKAVKAQLLTPIQLKMLDAGQPIVVTCQTPSGASVEVRLQTALLDEDFEKVSKKGHSKGCWLSHGVYVAVLSDIENQSKKSAKTSESKGSAILPVEEMYKVLRGKPGKLRMTTETGEKCILTYFNPNAPANRCYETKGLCISLEVSGKSAATSLKKVTKELNSKELNTLRSGKPLELTFGNRVLTLESNPDGQLVELPNSRAK